MRSIRLLAALIFCLSILGTGWGESNFNQKIKVEILPSDSFAADYARAVDINRHPHLQFALSNISGNSVPALIVTLSAYDAKGHLRGQERWITQVDLATGFKVDSTLAVNIDLTPAARLTLGFAPVITYQGCAQNFCIECANSAKSTCGEGKVKSVGCTIGETCNCNFDCAGGDLQ